MSLFIFLFCPPFKVFYDSLKKNINKEDCYKGKNLFEYMELYLKLDVLILSDVFQAFRDISIKYYDLDPVHYISSTGLFGTQC
jgi:hypothetical protein